MITLRWILGLSTGGVLFGTIVLTMVASGFRKSFGASPTNPLIVALPYLALAILFAGILLPGQRWLLHLGGLTAATVLITCVVRMSDISLVGILYSVLWLLYYWLAAWRAVPTP